MMTRTNDLGKPVQIILDTDMGNDIDDALALAMLHALQSQGECELISVVVSKDNPYAAAYVDAMNTFYHRDHVSIGRVAGGVTPEDGNFIRQVVELANEVGESLFPRTTEDLDAYPWAVDELRRHLAAAEDHAVVIVMIGFSTNMAQLFESGPDGHSALDGLVLFEQKVKHVVMMAAEFSAEVLADPTQKKSEFNIRWDIPGARQFITNCPRPIYFSGLEVGSSILYPATALETDYNWCHNHPVVESYKRYLPMPYDRPTWDLTAVLFAVRPNQGYFGISESGIAEVDEDGFLRFLPHKGGRHRYLTVDESQRVLIGEEQALLAAQPLLSMQPC